MTGMIGKLYLKYIKLYNCFAVERLKKEKKKQLRIPTKYKKRKNINKKRTHVMYRTAFARRRF